MKQLVTRANLRQFAGGKSFVRGEDYFINGHVTSLSEDSGTILAEVEGSDIYHVALCSEDGSLTVDCTCPMGEDGNFCKHAVAAGLAWLANAASDTQGKADKKGKRSLKQAVNLSDVRVWLDQQEKKFLVDTLIELATTDAQLRGDLLLKAAQHGDKDAHLASVREAMTRATKLGSRWLDYREVRHFAAGISSVTESIPDLLKRGCAAEVIELVEYSLGRVESAAGQIDDSGGYLGGILQRLQELHLQACKDAKPQPEELARRLFAWEMQSAFDTFYNSASTYAELLGKQGLAAYRECAETEWKSLPQITPGHRDPEEYGRNYRLKTIMESLAHASGHIDALVAIKARNLSRPHAFLEIATLYRDAKRFDDALSWAERGSAAFPKWDGSALREFIADEFHRQKRHDEAMQLVWKQFTEAPTIAEYQNLKGHADRLRQWPAWRQKALGFIRDDIAQQISKAKKNPSDMWIGSVTTDHSRLVEIFVWEKDVEAAWEEARVGGCHNGLWLKLANLREKEFPADALPIYRKEVDHCVAQGHRGAYQDAVKLLRRIRELMARINQGDEFTGYLATVRTTHKIKRSFIKLAGKL